MQSFRTLANHPLSKLNAPMGSAQCGTAFGGNCTQAVLVSWTLAPLPLPTLLPLTLLLLLLLQKKVESLQRQGGEGDKHSQTQKLADMIMANVYRCACLPACPPARLPARLPVRPPAHLPWPSLTRPACCCGKPMHLAGMLPPQALPYLTRPWHKPHCLPAFNA